MARTIKHASPATVTYHALRGSFGKVNYFLTTTSLRDVAENLQLAPQMELNFSERIQRVINTRRVEKEILPYLEQNELRFFNALVCILLPDKDDDAGFWGFKEYADEAGETLKGLGELKIAKRVGRIVLDGQHRFEALRLLWESVKDKPSDPDSDIDVALVFVVVGSLGMFRARHKNLRSKTIEATRNLFAVLNKTARRVDKTTLLLIDDTDITNVMTRRLLEEGRIDDTVVKWTGGENLVPSDPYFVTIQVIRDAIQFYLRDSKSDITREYVTEEERQAGLDRLYYGTGIGIEVPLCDGVARLFNDATPRKRWRELLDKRKIEIEQQPESTVLNKTQQKAVETARASELAFTVAGQKSFFRATLETFQAKQRRNKKALTQSINLANAFFEQGYFRRKTSDDNPFFGVLFDAKGRMSWAERQVETARRILGHAMGSRSHPSPILDEFVDVSERAREIVEEYWRHTKPLQES